MIPACDHVSGQATKGRWTISAACTKILALCVLLHLLIRVTRHFDGGIDLDIADAASTAYIRFGNWLSAGSACSDSKSGLCLSSIGVNKNPGNNHPARGWAGLKFPVSPTAECSGTTSTFHRPKICAQHPAGINPSRPFRRGSACRLRMRMSAPSCSVIPRISLNTGSAINHSF